MYLFNEKFVLAGDDYALLTFPFPVVKKANKAVYKSLVKTISFLLDYTEQKGLKPIISCHDDRDVQPAQEMFPDAEIFFSNYVDDYFEIYRKARLVLGSRLHASILSAGLGKPFVNINLDMRGGGFSQTFGLSDWNLNIGMPNLEQLIARRIDTILSGDLAVFEEFYATKEKSRAVYEKFMDDVAADILKRAGNKPLDS